LGEAPPRQILGHPWVLFGESKMSKTTGNVLYADELAEEIGVDAVRYYLLATTPFARDGSITPELVYELYNADLANTIGNLVQRTIAMTNKYFAGIRPAGAAEDGTDRELYAVLENVQTVYREKMDAYLVQEALDAARDLARRANKYIDETMPWALAKDPALKDTRLRTVLGNLFLCIQTLSALYAPVMPGAAQRMAGYIAAVGDPVEEKPVPLFPRLGK